MSKPHGGPGAGARPGRLLTGVILLGWVGAIAALGVWLAAAQSQSRQQITARLQSRAALGAEFTALYADDIFARERQEARVWLTGRRVSASTFTRVSTGVGLQASVLLDRAGRLLAITPSKPALLGQNLAARYAHLAGALAGRPTASQVVRSAARGVPVVAFAVPFATRSGRRVYSGAYDVAESPLGVYVAHMLTTPGHRTFLVDATGKVIAGTVGATAPLSLSQIDPILARSTREHKTGAYTLHGRAQQFVTAEVPHMGWRVIVTVPQAQLYATIDGADRWLAWMAVGGFGIAGLLAIILIGRLRARGRRLAALNGELDRVAHTDALTGVPNRRSTETSLQIAVSAARRHDHELSVLLIDIDHFKRINDTHGHEEGDGVLARTALALASAIREEDAIGRWGGEEFLAILPFTGENAAGHVADRLRSAVSGQPRTEPSAAPVTVTIGVAQWAGETAQELIRRADAALYRGKSLGRDTVEIEPAFDGTPR